MDTFKMTDLNKFLIIFMLAIYFMLPLGLAQENDVLVTNGTESSLNDVAELEVVAAGTTPDSPLYGIDVALDKIRLALTFNKARRAEIALQIAEERLSEVQVMIAAKKEAAVERAEVEHKKSLSELTTTLDEVDESDETESIKFNARLRNKLALHKARQSEIVARVEAGLEGNFTESQKTKIVKLFTNINSRISDIEVTLINKRDKLKIRLKEKLNKTDDEIEVEVEKIESNVTDGLNPEKVLELIEKVQERISKVTEEAEEKGVEFLAVDILLNRSQVHLNKAVEAVENERYGRAFGQARASLALSRNAERIVNNPEKFATLKKRTVQAIKGIKTSLINETRTLTQERREELREKIEELREERRKRLEVISKSDMDVDEVIQKVPAPSFENVEEMVVNDKLKTSEEEDKLDTNEVSSVSTSNTAITNVVSNS